MMMRRPPQTLLISIWRKVRLLCGNQTHQIVLYLVTLLIFFLFSEIKNKITLYLFVCMSAFHHGLVEARAT